MTFFDYCFYRICRGYESSGESESWMRGWGTISFFYSSYTMFFLSILGIINEWNRYSVIVVVGSIMAGNLFFFNAKKYERLKAERHGIKERHYKLKGWLVTMLMASSLIALHFAF